MSSPTCHIGILCVLRSVRGLPGVAGAGQGGGAVLLYITLNCTWFAVKVLDQLYGFETCQLKPNPIGGCQIFSYTKALCVLTVLHDRYLTVPQDAFIDSAFEYSILVNLLLVLSAVCCVLC